MCVDYLDESPHELQWTQWVSVETDLPMIPPLLLNLSSGLRFRYLQECIHNVLPFPGTWQVKIWTNCSLHPAPNPALTSSLSSFCLTNSPSVYFGDSYFTWGLMSPGNTGGYVPGPNIHGLISIPELKDARVGRDGGPTPALQRRNHTPEGICENLRRSCPKAPCCHMAQGSVLSRYHMAFLSSCFSRCFRSWSFK